MKRRTLLFGAGAATLAPPRRSRANTPVLDALAVRARQELTYLRQGCGLNTAGMLALSVQNIVLGQVSAALAGYDALMGLPKSADPEVILETQAGLCQASQLVYLALAPKVGLLARDVNIFYPEFIPNGSHATVEVWWGGAWHWVDPTFGWIVRDPARAPMDFLSFLDVLVLDPETRAAWWRENQVGVMTLVRLEEGGTDWSAFLDAPHLSVESPRGTVVYAR